LEEISYYTCAPSNYRPIAVIPVVAVSIHSLACTHQGVYRSGKSTEDILLLAVDHIATSLHKGISGLGVHSTIVEWFKDYLLNHYHRVKSSANFSSW